MLSSRTIEAPATLIAQASQHPPLAPTLVVGADHEIAFEGALLATEAGLIEPVLMGDPREMDRLAEAHDWDIRGFRVIEAIGNEALGAATPAAAADPAIRAVMKGHVHTGTIMGALLKAEARIRTERKLAHVFHVTVPGCAHPLLLSDCALNVAPDEATFREIAAHMVHMCKAIGAERPKIVCLSATEKRLEAVPSSIAAGKLADWANAQGWDADFAGPFAFDNAISPEAARIKGLDHPAAGKADAIIVPSLETGNAIFKAMVYFMGACAAGVVLGGRVPIILTSRADPPATRLASAALAVLAFAEEYAESA